MSFWENTPAALMKAAEDIENFDADQALEDFIDMFDAKPAQAVKAISQFFMACIPSVQRLYEHELTTVDDKLYNLLEFSHASLQNKAENIPDDMYLQYMQAYMLVRVYTKGYQEARVSERRAEEYEIANNALKNIKANHYVSERLAPVQMESRATANGGSSLVYQAYHQDKSRFVVKVIKNERHSSNASMAYFFNEVNIFLQLQQVPNTHTIKLLMTMVWGDDFCCVMEHAWYGDLVSFKQRNSNLFNKLLPTLPLSTFKAVSFLHAQNIIHADLKPDNFLVRKDLSLAICDFGKSFNRNLIQLSSSFNPGGTPGYLPPELLLHCAPNKEQYLQATSLEPEDLYVTEGADIWSLGTTLWELYVRILDGSELKQLHADHVRLFSDPKRAHKETPYAIKASNKLNLAENRAVKKVLLNCWKIKPSSRITAREGVQLLEAADAERSHANRR